MFHPLRLDNFPTKYLADTLMSQTNTKNGNLATKLPDDFHGNTSLIRCTGAGGNDDACRVFMTNLIDTDFIIAVNFNFLSKFAEVLHNVVGERIIIINH